MIIDVDERRFPISVVAEAAGCLRVTLDAWRNRNHLFAHTVTGTKEEKLLSLADACVARAVQVMTENGISTANAIDAADTLMRLQIKRLLCEPENTSSLFGFHKGGRNKARVSFYFFRPKDFANIMAKTNGALNVFDITMIIDHVLKALKIEFLPKSKHRSLRTKSRPCARPDRQRIHRAETKSERLAKDVVAGPRTD